MFKPNEIPARELIDFEEAQTLRRLGALFRMERRSRPRYFDGRFLAARDLIRDQGYFLARQADLGRAIGTGIVTGLTINRVPGLATELTIAPGHGLTPAGEMVALTAPLRVRFADMPVAQRLDAAFGIRLAPNDPPRNRSGVYILALRPVEFTANPIAAYPTTIEGPRSVEDGDIIEGAVVTLIPYPIEGDMRNADAVRARVEREVFMLGSRRTAPVAALPLAMVGLAGDAVLWLDPYLVRREIGLEHRDVLGLGFAPRALREAHLLQYQRRLAEIDAPGRPSFPATTYFDVLPPGGRLPKSAIDPGDFSQNYFPPEVDVDLAVIPDDELPALIEESLLLPPIDLNLTGDELDSLAILALIPVARSAVAGLQTELGRTTRTLRMTAPNLVAKRLPLEVLRGIRLPRLTLPVVDTTNVVDEAWRRVLSQAGELWYVRRRNLAYKAEVTGVAAAVTAPERDVERDVVRRVGKAKFDNLREKATTPAASEMVKLMSSPTFERAPELLPAVVKSLENEKNLDRAAVMRVAADFNRPGFGEGLARLKQAQPGLVDKDMVDRLASTRALSGLDRLAAALPDDQLALIDKDALQELAASGELSELAAPGATLSAARLATLQKAKEKTAPRKRVSGGGRRKDKEK
jgi:hypothetical protein